MNSSATEELYEIKKQLASEYATFRDFCTALLARQEARHERERHASVQCVAV